MKNPSQRAYLVLSDGSIHEGWALGALGETVGEVVFNTGMTGYQEILSDPSYAGQLVLFTYPLIGNYGVNPDDFESDRLQPSGLIVKESCESPSNWRSTQTLHEFLLSRNCVSIRGIDTRSLTLRIREGGVTMGLITNEPDGGLERLRASKGYGERDFVASVTTKVPYAWGHQGREALDAWSETGNYKHKIAVLDCGLKFNILRRFAALGVKSIVLPASTSAEEVLAWNPDGIVLSPGPGDPARLGPVIETVRSLLDQRPIFGICLGNQLLTHAVGGRTYKLKFGHRGGNHPVKDLLDGSVTITSQNHGYAVDPDSVEGTGAEITQLNLNDGTVEGIQIRAARAKSIQYHPEASPGPWDSRRYFSEFVDSL